MPYGENITINVGDAVRIHPAYKNYKFKKLKYGVTYFVKEVEDFWVRYLETEDGGTILLNMDKRYFEHAGKAEQMKRDYQLKVGDVVLVVEGGYGLIEDDEGKYVEVAGFGDYYGKPGIAVKPTNNYRLATNITHDNMVGYETFGPKPMVLLNTKEEVKEAATEEYTGSSSNYYKVYVKHPTTLPEPYEAECADIIEALKLDFAEGNVLKALWRRAVARNSGIKKKGYDDGKYDAEKIKWFADVIAGRYLS